MLALMAAGMHDGVKWDLATIQQLTVTSPTVFFFGYVSLHNYNHR